MSIEPRGAVASYDAFQDRLTIWESTQNPHPLRTFLAETLGMQRVGIRVIQPHVGGAFGLKQPPFQEEPLVAYLARLLGRPIKWIEERAENFQSTGHSRDVQFHYEVAFNDDGMVLGLRVQGHRRRRGAHGTPRLGDVVRHRVLACPAVYKIPNNRIAAVGRGDQQVPVERLSRLRQGRGLVPDGPDHGPRRAETTGVDRARGAAPELHPARRVPVLPAVGSHPRQRQLPEGAAAACWSSIDYEGFPALQAAGAGGRAAASGSGIGQELTPEGLRDAGRAHDLGLRRGDRAGRTHPAR